MHKVLIAKVLPAADQGRAPPCVSKRLFWLGILNKLVETSVLINMTRPVVEFFKVASTKIT